MASSKKTFAQLMADVGAKIATYDKYHKQALEANKKAGDAKKELNDTRMKALSTGLMEIGISLDNVDVSWVVDACKFYKQHEQTVKAFRASGEGDSDASEIASSDEKDGLAGTPAMMASG